MRPISFLCAVVAGTAVRLVLSALPPFRRRRGRRRTRTLTTTSSQTSAPRRPTRSATSPSSSSVASELDRRAPILRGHIWAQTRIASHISVDCTFCLESILGIKTERVRETPCHHVFHASCLEKWVFYSANICLDWTQYSLSDDGSIETHVRPPVCPNCSADLCVLPEHLVTKVMLTAVARSLSLRDLATVAEMYEAGLVYRARPLSEPIPSTSTTAEVSPTNAERISVRVETTSPPRTEMAISSTLIRQDGGVSTRRAENISVGVEAGQRQMVAVGTRSTFVQRSESTASESYFPAAAFVHREEMGFRLKRWSLSEEFAWSRTGRGRRRWVGRRRMGEMVGPNMVVQVTS